MNHKEEEKLVIQLFRKSFADFPKGRLISSESPDFILIINRHTRLGIELTQIDRGRHNLIGKIKARIEAKNKKISLYRTATTGLQWLVIYVEDLQTVTSLNLKTKLENICFPSDFQKIFFFDLFSREVFQIKKLL
jgi:hypothetical protein